MSSVLTAILPALFPAIADGLRAAFTRWTHGAGAQPANVGELLQIMKADTDRLQVIAQLDAPGNVSQWVADARALQRPALATLILIAYAGAILIAAPPATVEALGNYAAMVIFYLFGDRGYQAMKGAR